jgi:large subunit ribosomal protein L25
MTTKVPNIDIAERDKTKNPRMLRREGRIPATVYGKGTESFTVDLDKKLFTYLYINTNPNLVSLAMNGKTFSAIVKRVQVEPISMDILNVEFMQVKADEKVKLSVSLVLENESPAVKLGGVLLQLLNEIEIEALPHNIPDKIIFDISTITDIGVTVNVGDIKYPEGVKPVMSEDIPVLKVNAPTTDSRDETAVAEGAAPAAEAAAAG